ncbi:MAG: site-specific DNA-methyltransferase [Chloroflexi bacterium]|nr:site-specific DNA-methyltransferase [Chloroflexota bacterium]
MDTNVLYYGDNLKILQEHILDSSIDLIYLDPPFNSSATYNVLFKEPGGKSSAAQIAAFEDTWQWGLESERALQEIAALPIASDETKEFISVLPKFVGQRTAMRAYLTMMAVRLVELRRVLKYTGSIYLHCDPTASHYLKLLMDTIFGAQNFRNEIVWKRSHAHNSAKRYGPIHDVILFYTRSESYGWSDIRIDYEPEYVNKFFKFDDNDGRGEYWTGDITGAGIRHGESGKPWRGFDPTVKNRHWMYPTAELDRLDAERRVFWPKTPGAWPKLKRYLAETKGVPLQDIFDDIYSLSTMGAPKGERLGYQTQKPLALLERIIQASSNEGDVVLDPFCGCGTAVVAAERLKRKWIGIDVTTLAIGVMEWRLKNMTPAPVYRVVGEPADLTGAIDLFNRDRYQFQWWAVKKIGGQPYGDRKKGADTGIDGYVYYMDEKDKVKKAIVSVKGGGVQVSMIRDLGHVIEREKADIGVFVTLEKPTRPMSEEAALKGFYNSPNGRDYPRLQILTIEEILGGKMAEIPPWIAPIAPPPAAKKVQGKTARLL